MQIEKWVDEVMKEKNGVRGGGREMELTSKDGLQNELFRGPWPICPGKILTHLGDCLPR